MKNNFVKILATLGLIIAIALILRGVFDVGKIGFKNLISKDIFLECKNSKNDEIFTVKLNDKEKLWEEDWGNFKVLKWDQNKIEGYYITSTQSKLADGTWGEKKQISKEDYSLDRRSGRLEINVYPTSKPFYRLNYDCKLAEKKF